MTDYPELAKKCKVIFKSAGDPRHKFTLAIGGMPLH
jgi:hypothetical protein